MARQRPGEEEKACLQHTSLISVGWSLVFMAFSLFSTCAVQLLCFTLKSAVLEPFQNQPVVHGEKEEKIFWGKLWWELEWWEENHCYSHLLQPPSRNWGFSEYKSLGLSNFAARERKGHRARTKPLTPAPWPSPCLGSPRDVATWKQHPRDAALLWGVLGTISSTLLPDWHWPRETGKKGAYKPDPQKPVSSTGCWLRKTFKK